MLLFSYLPSLNDVFQCNSKINLKWVYFIFVVGICICVTKTKLCFSLIRWARLHRKSALGCSCERFTIVISTSILVMYFNKLLDFLFIFQKSRKYSDILFQKILCVLQNQNMKNKTEDWQTKMKIHALIRLNKAKKYSYSPKVIRLELSQNFSKLKKKKNTKEAIFLQYLTNLPWLSWYSSLLDTVRSYSSKEADLFLKDWLDFQGFQAK